MRNIWIALAIFALAAVARCPVANAATEKVLYSFCSQQNCADGEMPVTGLINAKGTFYGTTVGGGNADEGNCGSQYGCGTVFSIDSKTGTEFVLHSFENNGVDGYAPSADLIDINGTLFGTTAAGGSGEIYRYQWSTGTVFSIDLANEAETVLYSFCSLPKCADGASPQGKLLDVDGTVYGSTYFGGKHRNGAGAVFAIDPETGVETVQRSFGYESRNGDYPNGDLIETGSKIYGTTYQGGTGSCYGTGVAGCGTVFTIDEKTGRYKVVYSFSNGDSDGAFPFAGLIEVDHKLYGTTYVGGKGDCPFQDGTVGCGTVFSLDIKTGDEKVLYFFCSQPNCVDGDQPASGLINIKGTLYGTTSGGGAYGGGTVFSIDPATGAETVVYSFCSQQNCVDGWRPWAGLINENGTLYGTTEFGGANCLKNENEGCGTVFSIKP